MTHKARLPLIGIALTAAALLLGSFAFAGSKADAQVLPPHALSGSVTLDGSAAPAGTSVEALIDGTVCGQTTVNDQGRYVIQVKNSSAQSGCGTDGATISFRVGGNNANETFVFKTGGSDDLNLTASSAAPAPPPPPPPPPPPAATATPSIVTGTGGYLSEDSGGTAWWAVGLGLVALALATAGWVAHRRFSR